MWLYILKFNTYILEHGIDMPLKDDKIKGTQVSWKMMQI